MAVDEDRLTRGDPPHGVCGRKPARPRPPCAAGASVVSSSLALVRDLLIPESATQVLQSPPVRDPRQEELCPVVGEDGVGGLPVARPRLGEVLEDGDHLDPLSGCGSGDLGQVANRRGVSRLIEHDQQGRLARTPGCSTRIRAVDDVLDEAGEEGSQALLVLGGCDYVEGVGTLKESLDAGAAIILWSGGGIDYGIRAARNTAASGWAATKTISFSPTAQTPDLAVSGGGDAIATWKAQDGVRVSEFTSSAGWTAHRLIGPTGLRPSVATNDAGQVVLAWAQPGPFDNPVLAPTESVRALGGSIRGGLMALDHPHGRG